MTGTTGRGRPHPKMGATPVSTGIGAIHTPRARAYCYDDDLLYFYSDASQSDETVDE